ncbi:MAG: hypothetical protein JWQ38_2045 [Flavipsychrobacter sp.]|nr:hypothetical protein [Flavipsychrobacter sp.]
MKYSCCCRRVISSLFFLLFLMLCNRSDAQFGAQLSSFAPKGDIGQYFKKGASIDIYINVQSNDYKWLYRWGFFHTALSSRIDTVPVYGVMGNTVLPGYLVNKNFTVNYLGIDLNRLVVKTHGFSIYLGVGIIAGQSHVNYVEHIETVSNEVGDIDSWIAGLKFNAMLNYQVNKHFDVFFDVSKNFITATDYTTSYTSNKSGIGVNYYIRNRK